LFIFCQTLAFNVKCVLICRIVSNYQKMDYSNRRGKVNRSHAFYGLSKSSKLSSLATERRQESSEMINSSNLGLKECNMLNDYEDVINHQYEEPNNIIKCLARSSSANRRSRNLSNQGKLVCTPHWYVNIMHESVKSMLSKWFLSLFSSYWLSHPLSQRILVLHILLILYLFLS